MKTKLFSLYLKSKWKKAYENQLDPSSAQEAAFQKLKRSLKGTKAAAKAKLAKTENFENFVTQTPVSTYSDISDSVQEQLAAPNSGALFFDNLQFIGLSSGTTASTSKKILFNENVLKSFESFQLSFGAVLEAHTPIRLLKDKRLTWGSSAEVEKTADGVACGYVSGFLSQRSPRMVQSLSFPSVETARIQDMKEKIARVAVEAFGQDIRMLTGVPSYLINLLEELRSEWKIKNFSEVWPHLSTIVYSGTNIEPFKEQLCELIGHSVKFVGAYVSTEGPIGYEIPSLTGDQNGVYAFHFGDFVYGFRRLGGENGATLPIGELRVGDEVELLISSPSGLLNYSMGDVLRIRSIDPIITFEILGRLGQGLNVAAEKVSMSDLQKTVVFASKRVQQAIRHFFVHPGRAANGRPCYEWTLLVDDTNALDVKQARAALDHELMELNADYKECRLETFFLESPIIKVMSSDVQKIYFEREAHRGQLKMKNCFDSKEKFTEFLSQLLPETQSVHASI